jgi:hypothetical protein
MSDPDEIDLTEEERKALHDLQLGIEQIYRGYGNLLAFHHSLGRGMDHLDDAQQTLREAGHSAMAEELRDEQLPTGIIGDMWTYELVEAFESEFLDGVTSFEGEVREELANGQRHVTERQQQQHWSERADTDKQN